MVENPDLDDLYAEIILDHYRNPRNTGLLAEPDLQAEGFNPFCGDRVSLTLALEPRRRHRARRFPRRGLLHQPGVRLDYDGVAQGQERAGGARPQRRLPCADGGRGVAGRSDPGGVRGVDGARRRQALPCPHQVRAAALGYASRRRWRSRLTPRSARTSRRPIPPFHRGAHGLRRRPGADGAVIANWASGFLREASTTALAVSSCGKRSASGGEVQNLPCETAR